MGFGFDIENGFYVGKYLVGYGRESGFCYYYWYSFGNDIYCVNE